MDKIKIFLRNLYEFDWLDFGYKFISSLFCFLMFSFGLSVLGIFFYFITLPISNTDTLIKNEIIIANVKYMTKTPSGNIYLHFQPKSTNEIIKIYLEDGTFQIRAENKINKQLINSCWFKYCREETVYEIIE